MTGQELVTKINQEIAEAGYKQEVFAIGPSGILIPAKVLLPAGFQLIINLCQMTTNLTVSATFLTTGKQPATGLTLSDIKFYLTSQNKSTGVDTVIWDGTQVATVEVDNMGEYTRILTTADLAVNDYFAAAKYTGATVLNGTAPYWCRGRVSMSEADVRSMATDVITAAALSSGAATEIVTAIFAGTMEGRAFEEILKDIWAQVVGDFVADDSDEPTSIVYEGPNGATQLTHTITDTTRSWS